MMKRCLLRALFLLSVFVLMGDRENCPELSCPCGSKGARQVNYNSDAVVQVHQTPTVTLVPAPPSPPVIAWTQQGGDASAGAAVAAPSRNEIIGALTISDAALRASAAAGMDVSESSTGAVDGSVNESNSVAPTTPSGSGTFAHAHVPPIALGDMAHPSPASSAPRAGPASAHAAAPAAAGQVIHTRQPSSIADAQLARDLTIRVLSPHATARTIRAGAAATEPQCVCPNPLNQPPS